MSTAGANGAAKKTAATAVKDVQPAKTIKDALAQKQPPPETSAAISTRRWVVLSFWAVVIFLGFPIWWKTTSVYRASLPLQAMDDWESGKICRPVFPLHIAVEAPSIQPQEAQGLLRMTQHAIDDLNEFSAHHLRLVLSDSGPSPNASMELPGAGQDNIRGTGRQGDEETALTIRLVASDGVTLPRTALEAHAPILTVYYAPNQLPSSSAASSPLATYIANELQAVFAEEQAGLDHLLSKNLNGQGRQLKALSPQTIVDLERKTTRAFKCAPTYHLTFSLFTPDGSPSDWDIEDALHEYITPLLDAMSEISNFTVDSQVQLYAGFSPSIRQPEFDEERQAWTLRQEDLSGFINAAEWPLSPSIGAGPTVNFVIYVPSASQSPLLVKENGGSSWLIPQWGGVLILNPTDLTASRPHKLSKDSLRPAMLTFSSQLLSLLGLPDTPASFPLRIATLTRIRAASLLFSASSTLGALARLTVQLPSIAIPDSVADSVSSTLAHLQSSCDALKTGRFHAALEHGRIAETEAEKAFFERSMVGMVYFPDEHKVAVYLPLLGPVAVPLVLAAIKEIKTLVQGLSGR